MAIKKLEKILSFASFTCNLTAVAFGITCLTSVDWVNDQFNCRFGLFRQCLSRQCTTLSNGYPWLEAVAAFMILGCIVGGFGTILDVASIFAHNSNENGSWKLIKKGGAAMVIVAGIFTMIGAAVFASYGFNLVEMEGTCGLTSPSSYGAGFGLSWMPFILYLTGGGISLFFILNVNKLINTRTEPEIGNAQQVHDLQAPSSQDLSSSVHSRGKLTPIDKTGKTLPSIETQNIESRKDIHQKLPPIKTEKEQSRKTTYSSTENDGSKKGQKRRKKRKKLEEKQETENL